MTLLKSDRFRLFAAIRSSCRVVGIAHLSSWSCQPAFGLGHPFFAARRSASISAFAFAAVGPIAQTVIRMRPA